MDYFFTNSENNSHRITQSQKDANDKEWYKNQARLYNVMATRSSNFMSYGNITSFKRKRVNYELFNNIIDNNDFAYVCQPFGAEAGDLPANFTNRDIVSGKIKVLLGMEMKMPFDWKVFAVNEEATTRKEQEEFGRIRDFVVAEVMNPIKQHIQEQALEKTKGKKLTIEEQQQIQQQIQSETETQTPDEVRRYMQREHQDPAEVQMHQILEYLIQKEDIPDKFNKGFKHMMLSGECIYQIGIFNGEPGIRVTNPIRFDYGKSPDSDLVEDAEWHVNELKMTPSEFIKIFGEELTDVQIDRIYSFNNNPTLSPFVDSTLVWTFDGENNNEANTLVVKHICFTSLRKIGFLTYIDEQGQEQEDVVDENYKINKRAGDVKIEWDWIPEKHQVWQVLNDIFVGAGPIPGQHKDLDNLYTCKGPYYGASVDSLNCATTAPMDRMKAYQYFYDVILYRIELLMASDKGKILVANIKSIPKSAGIDTEKFLYFMEANKIAFLNPSEEGNRGASADVTNLVKQVDMSLASDISQYIQFAEYIERKCGAAIGVTPQMEAQISASEAVGNTRQNLVQSSYIIQPYFQLHNTVKKNSLQALLECAKVAYSGGKQRKLSYVVDDMSYRMFTVDQNLLSNSTMGLFVANSSKAEDAKQVILQLGQAAMQNQQASLQDIIKVVRSSSVTEAEELLEVSQQKREQQAQTNEQAMLKQKEDAQAKTDELRREEMTHEADMIILKAGEDRKTVLQKQAMLSVGFDVDKDEDGDGEPDVIELYKHGLDVNIKTRQEDRADRQLTLEQQKLDHQKVNDKEKNKIDKIKANKPSSKS